MATVDSKFLRFLQSQSFTNSYNYSNYNSKSTNENLSSKTLESTASDESVVYITKSGISITNSNLKKTSGDSSKTENSEFYGVNAAVLVQGGELTITGGTIQTSAKGANAVCATNKGTVKITDTKITSTASGSARGLHSTFGGSITASNVEITTSGGSCATLATDRGEGKVTCTECTLKTGGAGSPLIYSTGDISISKTKGTATGAQMVVVEGKNTANVVMVMEIEITLIYVELCYINHFREMQLLEQVLLIVRIHKWKYYPQVLCIVLHLCFLLQIPILLLI